jgi:ABC-type transport system substrate-binding protein
MAATNRQAIMDQVFSSQAVPALGPSHPEMGILRRVEPYRYDIDLARQLLAGAGYGWSEAGQLMTPEGAQASLTLMVQDDEIHSQIATSWQKTGLPSASMWFWM